MDNHKLSPSSGWILVTGLLLLCILGTALTWWNYSRKVFSSAQGILLEKQWPENRISVKLPLEEAKVLLPGHEARITVGNDPHLLQGEVVSVTPGTETATIIIRLIERPEKVAASLKPLAATGKSSYENLPAGTPCQVTIDTTVPPRSANTPQ